MLWELLISFAVFLLLGVPVAFAMGLSALTALLLAGQISLMLIPQRLVVALDSFSLMAVPLFILAGQLMNTGGITVRIIRFSEILVGHIRGGLSHVNVMASMIFSGVSGSATADAAGIGAVLIPSMVKKGYDEDWAVSITASSSTIGPIIPPSILMVIYGSMTRLSIGKLFLSGLIPGLLVGLSLMVMGYILAVRRKQSSQPRSSLAEAWRAFKDAFLPLLAPVIILVGITGGIFTATEAGVIAAVYALFLGVLYKEITLANLGKTLLTAAYNTTVILLIIACASSFGWILAREQFPMLMVNLLTTLSADPTVALILIIILMLIVGLFIEGLAALMIFVPVLVPVAQSFGFDPIFFALIMVLCIQIGAVTPPVGMLLFVSCSAGGVPLKRVGNLIWFFILGLLGVLALVVIFPALVTYLPGLI
jgi:tripartite ATP-independent transporter DctM subunit